MSRHVLVVRLDSLGDMLICGPAIRAIAWDADRVTVLAGPAGAEAARLLPGVDAVHVWDCPWIAATPPPVEHGDVAGIIRAISALGISEAVILTSYHQSALPTALMLRLAGVARISAISDDYPGSLLDVRIPSPPDAAEPVRMLAVAQAAGFRLPPGDDGGLSVAIGPRPYWLPDAEYVVVHPGASAPARCYPLDRWQAVVEQLSAAGRTVLVTGSAAEAALTAAVATAAHRPGTVRDCAGAWDLAELAAVLAYAAVVVVANTGPAHLAAAVGTPVVSLFAPVVSAVRWAPFGVARVVLGDQEAACRQTRARQCPIAGHPCLSSVSATQVRNAVDQLAASNGVEVRA